MVSLEPSLLVSYSEYSVQSILSCFATLLCLVCFLPSLGGRGAFWLFYWPWPSMKQDLGSVPNRGVAIHHSTSSSLRNFFEIHVARLCRHFRANDARQVMASTQEKDDKDIRSPLGNKSAVWKYFGFRRKDGSTDKTHAICKLCQCELKYSGNTTKLAGHLKKKHGIDPHANAPMLQRYRVSWLKGPQGLFELTD